MINPKQFLLERLPLSSNQMHLMCKVSDAYKIMIQYADYCKKCKNKFSVSYWDINNDTINVEVEADCELDAVQEISKIYPKARFIIVTPI